MTPAVQTEAAFPPAERIDTGDIVLAVHSLGDGPPVVLLHGFPELAYSWRHQLPALADAGYRAIAPDMRGYGGSDKPDGVDRYTIQHLVGDVCGLLDALDLERAVIVGHDWGALVSWQMALLKPERMAGLINLNIPFFRRTPLNPVLLMRWKLGKDFYIVNFNRTDEADRRFGADPRRFIDYIMRRRQRMPAPVGEKRKKRRTISLLALLDLERPPGERFLSDAELSVYARAFEAGGFTGPINWYRNFRHNWKSTKNIEQRVRVPTLFIGASDDIVVAPRQIEAMKPWVDDLEIHMIDDCSHWTQQDRPERVNELLLDWLARRYPV